MTTWLSLVIMTIPFSATNKIVFYDIHVLCSTLAILHLIFYFEVGADSLAINWDVQ